MNLFLACQIFGLIDALDLPGEKEIIYVAMTNHHGDHCFGAGAYAKNATFVLNEATYTYLPTPATLQREIFLLENLLGFTENYGIRTAAQAATYDPAIFPDATNVESYLDIGDNRTLTLLSFGFLQTDGDMLIYDEVSRSLWTGNILLGPNALPFLLDGGAIDAIPSYMRFRDWLIAKGEPLTIVAGHGLPFFDLTAAIDLVEPIIAYLLNLVDLVTKAIDQNLSLQETCQFANLTNVINNDPRFALVPEVVHWTNLVPTYFQLGGNDTQPFCF